MALETLLQWESDMEHYERKFGATLTDPEKLAAIREIMPVEIYEGKSGMGAVFRGKRHNVWKDARQELVDYLGETGDYDEYERKERWNECSGRQDERADNKRNGRKGEESRRGVMYTERIWRMVEPRKR